MVMFVLVIGAIEHQKKRAEKGGGNVGVWDNPHGYITFALINMINKDMYTYFQKC